MLTALGELALAAGIRRFTLEMQADNRPVLRLVRRLYPDAAMTHAQGMYETTVAI
jgi:hypothetical protein